jgi:DNA mismatch repair protein MutL
MNIIQLLPDAIANQIAAGEVVQRPASVVKELLENSIDAGSTVIKLIVKDAGRTLIQVIDNGAGMTETDARMCFERHATSKIKTAADLFALQTMGFRGEAMASIGAVAQVELKTRRADSELGTRVVVADSQVNAHEPIATPEGTNIAVKNLFYNVPARRNFLKSNSVEMRHIIDEFQRVAMAHPHIFFSLTHNENEIYHLAAGNLRQRIVGILGKEYNARLVPMSEETDVVQISGFVGKPEAAKKTRGEQFFFVNKRFIKSSYLQHAVTAAYDELISRDSHALYIIFIEIDPTRIDVNVHPTKQEIKFDDEKLVYNYLKVATRYALGTNSVMPSLDFDADNYFINMPIQPTRHRNNDDEAGMATVAAFSSRLNTEDDAETPVFRSRLSQNTENNTPFGKPEKSALQKNNLSDWQKIYEGIDDFDTNNDDENVVVRSKLTNIPPPQTPQLHLTTASQKPPYQLHQRYIISPLKSGFLLIDQQAAHERVLYERYLDMLSAQQIAVQPSMFPKTITLSPADTALLLDILPDINALGFDIREFGTHTFVLQGVPAELPANFDEQQLIETLLEQYKTHETVSLDLRERVARAFARQNAVRRGQDLAPETMQLLIDELFACSNPLQSPFGNTCFVMYELDDIEKRFAAR